MSDDDEVAAIACIVLGLFLLCWGGLGWGLSCNTGETRVRNPAGPGHVCMVRKRG